MIFTIIERRRRRRPHHVHLSLPTYITKGYIMSKTLTLPNDAQATIKLTAVDALGAPIAVPAGGSATSSDTTLFNASVDANGNVIAVAIPGSLGTGELTYTNGKLSDTATVVVSAPAAQSVSLDVDDAVLAAAPAAASTPAGAPLGGSTVLPTA